METEVKKNPEVLYKFRSLSDKFGRNFLFKQKMFFSSPSSFNDPYDCALPLNYSSTELNNDELMFQKFYKMLKSQMPHLGEEKIISESIAAIARKEYRHKDFFQYIGKEISLKVNNEYGIFSLSSNPLDYLLWSHYAGKHMGYCLGKHNDTSYYFHYEQDEVTTLDHAFLATMKSRAICNLCR